MVQKKCYTNRDWMMFESAQLTMFALLMQQLTGSILSEGTAAESTAQSDMLKGKLFANFTAEIICGKFFGKGERLDIGIGGLTRLCFIIENRVFPITAGNKCSLRQSKGLEK
jgi:hypothetical protein